MEQAIDPQTLTIAFERRLSATPEQVFDAWTRPEQVAAWWDPAGEPLRECTIDLRLGGSFRFVNLHHEGAFAGTYTEIDRPRRLVFEAMGSVGTVSLEEAGSGTRMRVTIRCSSKQQLEQFVQMGVATNTGRTLDNLVRHVGAVAAS